MLPLVDRERSRFQRPVAWAALNLEPEIAGVTRTPLALWCPCSATRPPVLDVASRQGSPSLGRALPLDPSYSSRVFVSSMPKSTLRILRNQMMGRVRWSRPETPSAALPLQLKTMAGGADICSISRRTRTALLASSTATSAQRTSAPAATGCVIFQPCASPSGRAPAVSESALTLTGQQLCNRLPHPGVHRP